MARPPAPEKSPGSRRRRAASVTSRGRRPVLVAPTKTASGGPLTHCEHALTRLASFECSQPASPKHIASCDCFKTKLVQLRRHYQSVG